MFDGNSEGARFVLRHPLPPSAYSALDDVEENMYAGDGGADGDGGLMVDDEATDASSTDLNPIFKPVPCDDVQEVIRELGIPGPRHKCFACMYVGQNRGAKIPDQRLAAVFQTMSDGIGESWPPALAVQVTRPHASAVYPSVCSFLTAVAYATGGQAVRVVAQGDQLNQGRTGKVAQVDGSLHLGSLVHTHVRPRDSAMAAPDDAAVHHFQDSLHGLGARQCNDGGHKARQGPVDDFAERYSSMVHCQCQGTPQTLLFPRGSHDGSQIRVEWGHLPEKATRVAVFRQGEANARGRRRGCRRLKKKK